MPRKLTQDQQAASDARKAAFRALAAKVAAMTDAERSALAARCPVTTIEGRTLSPFNQCLVISQCQNATIVGGFRQWIDAGRCVRKGEHGLMIWCPASKKGDDGEPGDTFCVHGTVVDVSQTDVAVAREQEQEAKPAPSSPRASVQRRQEPQHPQAYYSNEFTPL